MGLVGILCGLVLLVWLAFRGWSVLLLAPAAALLAAAFAREPLLANWTQTFMGGAAGFLAQFVPLFLLGALFGKLMEDSSAVSAIANFMIQRLGQRRPAGSRARWRPGHLWRGQPVRRVLRAGPHGGITVPLGGDSSPVDACGDRARHLHLHHVVAPGHACDPERDPDAVLRYHAVRNAGHRHHRLSHHARVRPMVAQPC